MKKAVLLFFIAYIALLLPSTQAQDYNPLIRPNTYWDVMTPDGWGIYPCYYTNGMRYFFERDTLINDIEYQILRRYPMVSTNPNGYFCPPYAVGNGSHIVAFMREDIEKQQVFMYGKKGSDFEYDKEILLYDFSLETSDTLFFFPNSDDSFLSGLYITVYETEIIELANGETRKSMIMATTGYPTTHIEGIGNSLGLIFDEYFITDIYSQLTCVSENGIQLYGEDQCFNFLGIDEAFAYNNPIKLYPNPAKSDKIFTLTCNEPLRELAVYNLKGTLVQTIETVDSRQTYHITLNTGIKSGIYILKVQTTKNQSYHEKIILY